MYLPNFLDGFDRLVAFDAETTGKRIPDAEFIRKQPFAWKAPGIIIEVGFVEMLRDGEGYSGPKSWTWELDRIEPEVGPEQSKFTDVTHVIALLQQQYDLDLSPPPPA
jgi:hypothetical protein